MSQRGGRFGKEEQRRNMRTFAANFLRGKTNKVRQLRRGPLVKWI